MATIYEELHAAALRADFAPRREGEPKETYIPRLLKAVYAASEADESVWRSLSERTQSWYNSAINRINSHLAISECPGLHDPEDAEPRAGKELTRQIREIVAEHPTWTSREVGEELKRRGWREREFRAGTIATVRSVTLDTMRVLKGMGFLKETVEV